jgi:nucleotide-binding universal stress UspA family protein
MSESQGCGTSGVTIDETRFASIVVALDLEPVGDRALPVARSLAGIGTLPVELLTVSSPHMDQCADADELRRRALASGFGPDNWCIVHENDPARAIIDHVATLDRALLVMATTAKGPAAGHFLGSVSEDVLRLITDPVLLVGPRVPSTYTLAVPTLIVCVDEGDTADAAVPAIAAWMQTFRSARPLIAEVIPAPYDLQAGAELAEASQVRNYAARLAAHGIDASHKTLHGNDAEIWLNELAENTTDSVLVAASVRWTHGHFHGSTTRRLVRISTRPVLVVPAG